MNRFSIFFYSTKDYVNDEYSRMKNILKYVLVYLIHLVLIIPYLNMHDIHPFKGGDSDQIYELKKLKK